MTDPMTAARQLMKDPPHFNGLPSQHAIEAARNYLLMALVEEVQRLSRVICRHHDGSDCNDSCKGASHD